MVGVVRLPGTPGHARPPRLRRVKGMEAEQYQVYVDADRADEAVRAGGLL